MPEHLESLRFVPRRAALRAHVVSTPESERPGKAPIDSFVTREWARQKSSTLFISRKWIGTQTWTTLQSEDALIRANATDFPYAQLFTCMVLLHRNAPGPSHQQPGWLPGF